LAFILAFTSRTLNAERDRFPESELEKVNDFTDGPAPLEARPLLF
jgi:hypothetical protein